MQTFSCEQPPKTTIRGSRWPFTLNHILMLFCWHLAKPSKLISVSLLLLAAIDCEVGLWGPWSPCTSSCGVGSTERSRQVLVPPRNGGTPCPDLKQRRGCFGNNAICSTVKGEITAFMLFWSHIYACTHSCSLGYLLVTSVPKPYPQLHYFKNSSCTFLRKGDKCDFKVISIALQNTLLHLKH